MFKSVFTKYMTAFAVIIFISFVMLSAIIGSMLNSYAIDAKQEDVAWAADVSHRWLSLQVQDFTEEDFAYYLQQSSPQLTAHLSLFATPQKDLKLFLTDTAGEIIITDEHITSLQNSHMPTAVQQQLTEEGAYRAVSSLEGLLNGQHLVHGRVIESQSGTFLGAVFVCSASTSAGTLVNVMTKTMIMASLWIMLAAMIAVYFISDRMVGPLRSMIAAAKQFGKGKFDTRVRITGQDEIGELAEAFNNMAESLDKLENMRNSFLASVSHDLRTPMTTIAGFIEGINSGAIPPEKHEYYLDIIAGEVHRLSRLVGMLLDVSRLESGDRKFVFAPFDICETARLVLIAFEQKINDKHLEVDFECAAESMMAHGDKDAIHQLLYNLCENAIKFSRESGALKVGIAYRSAHQIAVRITNEGEGIVKEDIPYIFERFYKTDKSRGLDKSGVGLGLYICKTIIEAHGEKIEVQSQPGEYTEFSFTLKSASARK
ncbi:MAG: ATP-binding protein [Eubacteriales bacterium]